MRIAVAMASVVLMVGCSAQVRLARTAEDVSTRTGIAYSLPFTQFDVTVTRVVTACKPTAIEVSTKAEIGPASSAPDPSQTFTIDSNSLSGPFRIGSIKVDYGKAGVTKGLNAASEDRSAQVISSVLGTVLKIASLGTVSIPGPPAPVPAVGPLMVPATPPEEACAPRIKEAVDAIKEAAGNLATASAAAKAASKEFAALKAQADALPGALDEETKKRLVAAKVKSDKATATANGKKDALDKLREEITDVQAMTLPVTGSKFAGQEPPTKDLIALWKNPNYKADVGLISDVHWVLGPRNGDAEAAQPAKDDQSAPPGIPYRMSKPGRFTVCNGPCSKTTTMAEAAALISQLGRTYFLPCKSAAFSSMTCAVALDDSGAPTSVGSDQKSSPAEGLAGVAKDAATQYVAYRKSKSEAELDALKAQSELVKARTDLAVAQAAAKANPSADVEAATAALKADIEYWTAVKTDAEARAAAGQ